MQLLLPYPDPEQALIDAVRAARGLPPGQKLAVCQHSCAPEDIPDCTAFNCEAAWICDTADSEAVRDAAVAGDFAGFAQVPVQLAMPHDDALLAAARAFGLEVGVHPQQVTLSGNLLQLARFSLQAHLPPAASELLREIEQTLVWQFGNGGACLLRERRRDLRRTPEQRGSLIALYGRNAWPGHAVVAWEAPPRRGKQPAEPEVTRGFGVESQPSRGYVLGPLRYGLDRRPGDLYGPTVRLEFRVDDEMAAAVVALFPTTALDDDQADANMAALLPKVTEVLGLPQPELDTTTGDGLRSARWLQRLLRQIPI